MAHPYQFPSFSYYQWYYPPPWPFPQPQPQPEPQPTPAPDPPPAKSTLQSTFVSQYLSKKDPLVLLMLVLATHDVSSKWEEMVQASRLLPDNRLWMKNRDDLCLNLVPYTDIAEELRNILDLQGEYLNPWLYSHQPGQCNQSNRRDRSPGRSSDSSESRALEEHLCIKRRNSDPISGGRTLWMRNLVEAQRAGKLGFVDQYLFLAGRVENWKDNISLPTNPPTPLWSTSTSSSRTRHRTRSPLANYEGGMSIVQSIEEDYTIGSQNRRSSDNDRIVLSSGDLEDERSRRLRSCTPVEELLDRPHRIRFAAVRSNPDSMSSMEFSTMRPRSHSDPSK